MNKLEYISYGLLLGVLVNLVVLLPYFTYMEITGQYKVTIKECYKPTFKDAEHTWHVVKCPFKGVK